MTAVGADARDPEKPSHKVAWVVAAVAFALAVLVLFFADQSRGWLVVAGACLAIFVLAVHRALRDFKPAPSRRWYYLAALLIVAAVSGVLTVFGADIDEGLDRLAIVFVLLTFVALGEIVSAARRFWSERTLLWVGGVGLALCAAVFVVGLVLLRGSSRNVGLGLAVGGILTSPIALGLTSEGVLHRLKSRQDWTWQIVLLLVGALLLLVGLSDLLSAGSSPLYVLIIMLVVVVLVGAITADIPGDIAVVLVVIAGTVPFAAKHTPVPLALQPQNNQNVLVSLGDSFMSGEGATRYFDDTNAPSPNNCRRAPSAYSSRMVLKEPPAQPESLKLLFVACSGAKAEKVERQVSGLGAYDDLEQVRAVIVSVGGNDALFGPIGKACLAPGDCSELRAPLMREVENVAPKLQAVYQKLDEQVEALWGSDVPIAVAPYPVPLADHGCSWSAFSDDEHKFLVDYTRALDDVIKQEADRARITYLDGMRTALDNKRICDGDPEDVGVNFFALNSVEGLLHERANPTNWVHNSLHPNEAGHRAMVAPLRDWVQSLPERSEPGDAQGAGPASTRAGENGVQAVATTDSSGLKHCGTRIKTTVKAEKERLEACGSELIDWMAVQSVDLFMRVAISLGFVILGSLGIWFAVISWTRRRLAG